MQKITPFLWFNDNLEEALSFYTAVFNDVKIKNIARYTEGSPGPAGTVMTAAFEICGQSFVGLNGGPVYQFTEAISFVVNCESQDEVDRYWNLLSDGGQPGRCGWLKDKFGLSWQIVPTALPRLLSGPDSAKTKRVMQAMMKMSKIEVGLLEDAAGDQEASSK